MKRKLAAAMALLLLCTPLASLALPDADPPAHELPFEQLVGDNGDYDTKPGDWPPAGTYRIVVDVTNQIVTVYETETNEIVRQTLCSTGTSKTPSPIGTFNSDKHRVRFGLFVNDGVYGQYWTQITRRIYFHSILYSRRNANTYTKTSYKNLGKRASHGCIRLPVPEARWIYFNIAPGTEVTITKQIPKNEELREKLALPVQPKTRPKGLDKVKPVQPTPAPKPTPTKAPNNF